MREIARNIARERMKRAGYEKINKKRSGLGGRSFFAVHWREAVDYQPNTIPAKYVHHKKRVKGAGKHKGLFGRRLFA